MKYKITIGKLTINLETLPEKKSDFEKLYKNRIPNVDTAWKECQKQAKKIKV